MNALYVYGLMMTAEAEAGPAPAYNFANVPTDWLHPATFLGAA